MKKSLLASSLIALFTSIGTANALTWTNAGEDLSSANAQMICDGSNVCSLIPVDPFSPISLTGDQLLISNPSNVSSFVFDSGDLDNPFSITGSTASTSDGILQFDTVGLDSFIVNADITNTAGHGIYLIDTDITNSLTVDGVLTATGGQAFKASSLTADILDFSADITSSDDVAISLENVSVVNDVIVDGSISSGTHSFYADQLTTNTLSLSADMTATTGEAVYLNFVTVLDSLTVSGALTGSSAFMSYGLTANSVNIDIVGTSDNLGVYFMGATVAESVLIDGTIDSGLAGVFLSGDSSANSFTVDADIISGAVGIDFTNASITNAVVVNGDITATDHGINLGTFTSDSLIINGVVVSSAANGINVTGDQIAGGLINNGSIESTTAAAIAFDATNDSLDYTGTGTLSGATFDIDMGDGDDTVHIYDANIYVPTMNSAETLMVTNSTLQLDLDDTNKATTLTTLTGTTGMSLADVVFDINTTVTGALVGDQYSLFDVDTIITDFSTLSVEFTGLNANGHFELIDNAGVDQLVYVLDEIGTDIWTNAALPGYPYTETALGLELASGDRSGYFLTISSVGLVDDQKTFENNGEMIHNSSVATEGVITVEGDNYLDLVNNGIIIAEGSAKGIAANGVVTINGSITNNGTIEVLTANTDAQAIRLAGTDASNLLTMTGDIVNAGTIDAYRGGIYTAFANITGSMINSGTITATTHTGLNNAATLSGDLINTETGVITTKASYGLFNNGTLGGGLINNGIITANTGMGTWGGSVQGISENNGDITATGYGVRYTYGSMGGFVNNGNVLSAYFGLDFELATITGDIINNGDVVITNGKNAINLYQNNMTGNFINNGLISSDNSLALHIHKGSFNGDVINNGTITGRYLTYIYKIALGDIINNGTMYGDDGSCIWNGYCSRGIYSESTTTVNNVINTSLINTQFSAIAFYLNSNINEDIINTSTGELIAREEDGIQLVGSTMLGNVVNAGSITSLSDRHAGVFFAHMNGQNVLENTGTIEGADGVVLSTEDVSYDSTIICENGDCSTSGQSYFSFVDGDLVDMDVYNTGTITARNGSAIVFKGTYDNVLNYSGSGTLSGTEYQIDMGDGNDTVNIANAVMSYPVMNSAENVTVSDSVLKLELNSINQNSVLIDATGSDTLSLTNVMFDVDVNLDTFTGSQLVLIETVDLTTDLETLDISFEGGLFTDFGSFEVVDNEGLDQLVFIFDENSPSIIPSAPASGGTERLGAVSLSSMSHALSVNSAVLNVIQQHKAVQKYSFMHSNHQFASSSDIQSDIKAIFSALTQEGTGLWTQAFGQTDSYEGRVENGSVSSFGYDSSVVGVTLGYDQRIAQNWLLGVATSYASSTITGEDDSFTTDAQSLQVNAYVSYVSEEFYVDGILGYGMGIYDQTRQAASDVAEADYYTSQFSAQMNVGRAFFMTENFVATPFLKTVYMSVLQEEYEETGSVDNLSVDELELSSFQAGGGLELGYIFDRSNYKIMPRLNFEYASELGDSVVDINTTVIATGGAGSALQTPDMGTDIYRVGFGVTYITEKGSLISLDYQNETRENYNSHSIFIKGKYIF